MRPLWFMFFFAALLCSNCRMMNILLAGLGVRGRHWAQVVLREPRCHLAAWVDPDAAAISRANADFGDRPAYASVQDALESHSDIDALVLANPPVDRMPILRAAAARKLPMLIEKPLALSLPEARQLVDAAQAAGISLMVGLNFRYLPVTIAAMDLLDSRAVGAAEFARFTYERWRDGRRPDLNDYPLTMQQPMLWEQSIHHFDLMRHVYRREPLRLQCQSWNPSWSMYASDSNVAALIEFEGGLRVNYQGTWQGAWAAPRFEWRTDCSQGVIVQRAQFGSLGYARRHDKLLKPVTLPPHERWITETRALFSAFVDHVRAGAPLECSGRDHLVSLAMLAACEQSSQSGDSVRIRDLLA